METMIEVFKTNVSDHQQAMKFLEIFRSQFPDHKINFDLDDCDKILRVEGKDDINSLIMKIVQDKGFLCEALA